MSQAVLLSQAVGSADDDKIKEIVSNLHNQPLLIKKTIEELPINQVLPLLDRIEKMLREDRISDVTPWLTWLNGVFTTHATYLSSISDLSTRLGLLTDWMHNRTRNLNKLLELQGKLELITQQMRQSSHPKKLVNEKHEVTFDGC